MASVWECARNDVIENLTVLLAAAGVWVTGNQWPDIAVAVLLSLVLYRSAFRIIRRSLSEIRRHRSLDAVVENGRRHETPSRRRRL